MTGQCAVHYESIVQTRHQPVRKQPEQVAVAAVNQIILVVMVDLVEVEILQPLLEII